MDTPAEALMKDSERRKLQQLIENSLIYVEWSGPGGEKGDVSLYAISEK